MQITLPAHLEQFIADQVQSGVFSSANEAVCKAVENLQSLEQRRAALEHDLEIGFQQIERGECTIVEHDNIQAYFAAFLEKARTRTSGEATAR
jgi:putative addiction module CopG family antidote